MIRTSVMVIAAALLLGSAGTAQARDWRQWDRGPGPQSAPEFSGDAAGSALALLGGGALVLMGRRRKVVRGG